jgi:hypothetical protein
MSTQMKTKGPHEPTLINNRGDDTALSRRNILLGTSTLVAAAALTSGALAQAQNAATAVPSGRKPNILVIFGDDIGQTDLSTYSFGLMGYSTPNIDRICVSALFSVTPSRPCRTRSSQSILWRRCSPVRLEWLGRLRSSKRATRDLVLR